MKAKLINSRTVDWAKLDSFADRTIFQSPEWLQFIHETQRAKIIVCELAEGRDIAGYFTGLRFSRFGVPMLGSSFPGWTTPYIGFNLTPGVSRKVALAAVEQFAWNELKCLHMIVLAADREQDSFAVQIKQGPLRRLIRGTGVLLS